MEKAFQIQKQVRDNAKTLQSYVTDLQNWELEMKRKEAALNGEFEQDLPPVRSKIKKEKLVQVKKKTEKKIKSYDYEAWDKFDVDKACEDVDMADIGPVSLDSKKSEEDKQEKLREEAQYEKERGNTFVKQEKWDEAIACYNRAIELIKDDAIYFANRGLCYLKKESLHQAESDCTEALRLDPTYVKAWQRRASARERLGSLRAASQDLVEVLKLEPHNNAAKKQLNAIRTRMGTKGSKSKSSPTTTPIVEIKKTPVQKSKMQPKIVELKDEPLRAPLLWPDEEKVTVIKPVKKPPHLRSKRPLKNIRIQEIQLGKTCPEKPPTRLKIIEMENERAHGDSNINNSNEAAVAPISSTGDGDINGPENDEYVVTERDIAIPEDNKIKAADSDNTSFVSPESMKLITDTMVMEKDVKKLAPPVNSVQFMAEWKYLKGKAGARCDYLRIIDPSKIPSIFENALESDVLSDVLRILHDNRDKFVEKTITAYLKGLSSVKRFSALAMFLSENDKLMLKNLLTHCKDAEKCSEEVIGDLKNKYEL